jgi:hypothetical protein
MLEQNRRPIIAVFADRGRAESAIDDLWHARFRHDQIGIATPGHGVTEATTPIGRAEDKAAQGASTGAITGGAVGAVVGAAAVATIPGIGPILAGGTLAGILASVAGGAAAGAAVGTYLGPFVAMGLSDEEARRYGRELHAGRTILTVDPDGREEEALQILRDHGPTDLRSEEWAESTPAGHHA